MLTFNHQKPNQCTNNLYYVFQNRKKHSRARAITAKQLELEIGSIVCDFEGCGREFNSALLLLIHQLETAHLNLRCTVCQNSFSRKSDVKRHITSMHLLQGQFECIHCPNGKRFNRLDGLHKHQLKHHGVVICDQCGARFNEVKWLKDHVIKYHTDLTVGILTKSNSTYYDMCIICVWYIIVGSTMHSSTDTIVIFHW